MEAGFEVWGAPSLRSHPDNYFLTQWEKHFKNIRDFVPACRKMGYKGMIMTSWSTSGQYSTVWESSDDIIDLLAIRHVYPITGFNMLLSAYSESLQKTLDVGAFVKTYSKVHYGFNEQQSDDFWQALTKCPFEVRQGKVLASSDMSVSQLADSQARSVSILYELQPLKNKEEFEHYRLMADIRMLYLSYQQVEAEVNDLHFSKARLPSVLSQLQKLLRDAKLIDRRFVLLNKSTLYEGAIVEENELRDSKIDLLYQRLAKARR